MNKDPFNPEQALFRNAIGKIQPVSYDKITRPRPKFSPHNIRKNQLEEDFILKQDFSNEKVNTVIGETPIWFARSGIQEKQLKNLRKGLLHCEAECDLHLLTQDQAAETLDRFIQDCTYNKNYRVVRIVHGKGNRSGQKGAVLKNLVNQRLRELPIVLAFCSAIARDGGAGAVYILLKQII